MNKRSILVVIGIIVLIVGATGYVLVSKKDAAAPVVPNAADNTSSPDTNETPKQPTKGEYVNYTAEKLKKTADTKLLFFHAPWCPQCRAIEASIEKDGVPSGVTVFKVDYDSNQALRQKYGVTLQTTFVKVDNNGDKIKSYTAYEEPTFEAVRRELLP